MASLPSSHRPPLVGRDRELTLLRGCLAATLAGQGGLVLIGGEAGIGKTTLAEAVCHEAEERGARVLIGRCYDLTETPAYGPWIDLFLRSPSSPDLPPLPPAFAARGTVGVVASQMALFVQVHDFLAAVAARQPTVLLLDDVHWADPASLDLLRFLARHLSSLPLLVIAAYRTDEVARDGPLYALLPNLVHEAKPQRITPQPLGTKDVRALVQARYGLPPDDEARLVAYLAGRAEGNPFFIGELLRTLEDEAVLRVTPEGWALGDVARVRVPMLVRQVIDRRLTRLDEDTRVLLAAAAAIGQEVPRALWREVAQVEEDVLFAAIERAAEERFMEEMPGGTHARFVHALVRDALYEGMPPSHRRAIHRQVGEAIAALPDPDPDAVAVHFHRAADARAVEWLLRAGERAQRNWAWLTAAERYEAALGLLGRADMGGRARLLYFIAVLRQFVRPGAGIALLDEAISLATGTGDEVLRACATIKRGNLRCYVRDYDRGLRDLEDGATALDALLPTDLPRIRALEEQGVDLIHHGWDSLATWRALLGRYEAARRLGERLTREMYPPNVAGEEKPLRSALYRALGIVYAGVGAPDAARAAYRQARDGVRALGEAYSVVIISVDEFERVLLPYHMDQVNIRRALIAEAEEAWSEASGVYPEADIPGFPRLPLLALEGKWEEARRSALLVRATESLAALRRVATRALCLVARHRGETDLAWALVQEELPGGPGTLPGHTRFLDAQIAQQLAIAVAIDAGDLPTARTWLEAHERWLAWSGSVPGRSEGQVLWAAYYRAAGDAAQAYDCATEALAHAGEPQQPLALLAAHRLLGELDTGAGGFDAAAMHLNAALSLAEACAAPYERALTLLALAELRAAEARSDDAATLLDEARAICLPLGAKPALARADVLVARLASDAAPRHPTGLTGRELEVLRLLAAGHTNRQIAALLSLSERTVHVHVRNIFAKTESDNRAGATAFAFRHRLA